MKMMPTKETEEKQNTIAQILTSIPLIVWKAFFTLLVALVVLEVVGRYFPDTGIAAFMNELLAWVTRILWVSGIVIVGKLTYGIFETYHDFRIKNAEYQSAQLGNQIKSSKAAKEQAEAAAWQAFSTHVQRGLEQGFNVDFRKMAMSSPFSNVHTLGNGTPQNVIDATPMGQIAAPLRRLTVDEICAHIERNSYCIFIGASLTRNLTPVAISIKGRHLKIIGATQKGKSSMVGALIDIVSRTHDPAHVQFALLDKEYQTSRLFADIPHLLMVVADDRPIPVHAKNVDEVVAYLGYLLQILEVRNAMSRTALAQEPIIIVYIEEFLRLKKELKAACATAQDKEEALRRYTQFSFAVGQLAGLGLKLRMYLWLVAQMDYADKDSELQEAMVNITSGLSFCVRQTAALAAGFYNTELLARNAQENKAGQAVCEMPDCNDLVLAPDYDLEQRLLAREQAEMEEEQANTIESDVSYTGPYLLKSETTAQPEYTPVYTPNVETPPSLPAIRHSGTRPATLTDAIEVWNECGGDIGRGTLMDALLARGLECSEDRAKKLIKSIKERLPIEKAE